MANVSVKDVEKIYPNGFHAIKGANLEIEPGEFIVLVGPSGCGKSTLLRTIAGLEEASSGEIRIGDRVVNDVDPADRNIAMVFQNYALYPHMSVYKNMAYGLKNRKMPKDQIDAQVQKAALMLGLSEHLDRKPSQLSGGQRQRVAMGRAIVRSPDLFLFDEPLSNLDAKLRGQMRIEIRKLQRELGVTSIYVTHDQVEAMTMADRIVVLNGGRIEQIGTPAEIYNSPASVFVASFMGAPPMNLLEGVADGNSVALPGGALPLDHEVSGPVTVGIRPEKAVITNQTNGATLPFTHDFTEELGAIRLVHGHLGETPFVVHTHDDTPLPDGPLYVSVSGENVNIFDQATGQKR